MQSYTHFTLKERKSIAIFLKKGYSIRKIANRFSCSPSSISREINRNKNDDGTYDPYIAQKKYKERRKKCKRKLKLQTDEKLQSFVVSKLKEYWSPEIISVIAKKNKLNISFKTIYNAIKANLLPDIKAETNLRRKGKPYCKDRHKFDTIHPVHTIRERTKGADNRSRFGHWEGDTILGAIGKGCVVTLIDRKSRILVAKKSETKSQEDVRNAMISAFEEMSVKIGVKSITLDNGSEFADFLNIEKKLNTIIYFADPHSPWQRGTNENINDVLRFFYPKGTDFHKITDEDIQEKVNLINNRPRKCLGYLSPLQYIEKKLCC